MRDDVRSSRQADELPVREQLYEAVDRQLPYIFVLPVVILVVGLVLYPVLWAIRLSLYQVALVSPGTQQFVGLANYIDVFADPVFETVLLNTAVFVGASVIGQVTTGLVLALLLDRSWLTESVARWYRLTYILPWATTGVIVAYSWQFVFHPEAGLLNAALRSIGVVSPPSWLSSVRWAMVAVVVATIWRGIPFSLILQTSGLQSIPPRLYEAADVGGASPLQTVRYVTLPLLGPFVVVNVVLVTLFTLNVFDIVYVLTGGGPLQATEILPLYMYDTAFEVGAFGRANAVAVVLLTINVAIVALALWLSRSRIRWQR